MGEKNKHHHLVGVVHPRQSSPRFPPAYVLSVYCSGKSGSWQLKEALKGERPVLEEVMGL